MRSLPQHFDALASAAAKWFEELDDRGVFITDERLIVRRWNHWLAAQTGRRAEDIVGRPLFELFPDLVTRGLDASYRDALSGEVRVLSQRFHKFLLPITRNFHGAGVTEMAQSARIEPLRDGESIIGTITLIEDVTERVISERELRNQIAASEQRAPAGRGSVAAQGRIPRDAVARDPHAAQRGDRLDPHSADAAVAPLARARARGHRAQRDVADAAGRGSARHGAHHQRQAAAEDRHGLARRGRAGGDRRGRARRRRQEHRDRGGVAPTMLPLVSGDSRTAPAGDLEPALERAEVHRARRQRAPRRRRRTATTSGCRSATTVRVCRRSSFRTCSIGSARPMRRRAGDTAASASACRWSARSSNCTAAPSASRAAASGRDRRSG